MHKLKWNVDRQTAFQLYIYIYIYIYRFIVFLQAPLAARIVKVLMIRGYTSNQKHAIYSNKTTKRVTPKLHWSSLYGTQGMKDGSASKNL